MAEVLHVVAGATFQEPLALLDRAGAPVDLSGAVLTFLAKDRIDAPDAQAVLVASTTDATIVVDTPESGGTLRFDIDAADTNALVPGGSYVWTLQVAAAGGVVRYPDGFQRGPGRLIVTASAISTVPA